MQFVFFTDRDKLFVLINKLWITVVNGFKEYEKNNLPYSSQCGKICKKRIILVEKA